MEDKWEPEVGDKGDKGDKAQSFSVNRVPTGSLKGLRRNEPRPAAGQVRLTRCQVGDQCQDQRNRVLSTGNKIPSRQKRRPKNVVTRSHERDQTGQESAIDKKNIS